MLVHQRVSVSMNPRTKHPLVSCAAGFPSSVRVRPYRVRFLRPLPLGVDPGRRRLAEKNGQHIFTPTLVYHNVSYPIPKLTNVSYPITRLLTNVSYPITGLLTNVSYPIRTPITNVSYPITMQWGPKGLQSIFIGLVHRTIYRKPPYLMVKTMVSG